MKTLFLLLIITFSTINVASANEPLVMALSATGNPPYSYFDNNSEIGIYRELLDEIFANTPYSINYIYLSSARIRTHFAENKTDIECCPIPTWREGETAISLYTNPIFATEDVLVFPKGKALRFESMKGVDVAVIGGYGYLNEQEFNRIDVENEMLILKLVANGRAPVGIVDRQVALFLIDRYNLNIEIGQVHESIERPLRIHARHKDKLNTINQAIEKIKAENKVATILNRYQTTSTQ